MKRFIYLFVTITAVIFSSCSSDDDAGTPAVINGKWMITEMNMEADITVEGMSAQVSGTALNSDPENYTIFHDDNTIEVNPVPMDMTMTVNVMGQTHTNTQVVNVAMPQTGTWLKEGDMLTIKEDGGETQNFRIETLSQSTLKLTTDNIYGDFDFEDGMEPSPGDFFEMTFTFSRL